MERFKNILYIMEGSDVNGPAMQRAVSLACENKAALTVADVLPIPDTVYFQPNPSRSRVLCLDLIQEREMVIKNSLNNLPDELNISIQVFTGKPFLEIIKAVLRDGYDLVIKSPDTRKSLKTSIFGSTDMHLLRKCPCPVWIVKADANPKIRNILAAIDLESFGDNEEWNALNQQIIEMSTSLAWNETCKLHIVYSWEVIGKDILELPWNDFLTDDVQSWMDSQKVEIQTRKNEFSAMLQNMLHENNREKLDYRVHLLEGAAEDVILKIVNENEIDLLIMGTVSRSDLAGFFIGSTAETVLNQINRSLLAVKPAGFVSPVMLDSSPTNSCRQ